MEAHIQKICCVCGLDVHQLKRIKDPRDRYYCQPCWSAKLAAHRRRLAALAAKSAVHQLTRERMPAPVIAAATVSMRARLEPQLDAPVVRSRIPESALGTLLVPGTRSRLILFACVVPLLAGALGVLTLVSSVQVQAAMIAAAVVCIGIIAVLWTAPRAQAAGVANVRLSDLLGAEAQAAVGAARSEPRRFDEPEIPVSPLTNPPVTALVQDYSRLLIPHPALAHAEPVAQ